MTVTGTASGGDVGATLVTAGAATLLLEYDATTGADEDGAPKVAGAAVVGTGAAGVGTGELAANTLDAATLDAGRGLTRAVDVAAAEGGHSVMVLGTAVIIAGFSLTWAAQIPAK